jgi:oxygen-dependent protoporphyrinogen oxidase
MAEEMDSEVLDTVIVGAGLAGLTVAYRLRNRDILVLEKEDRPGGRTLSFNMGEYVYNAGAQVVLGDDSLTAKLADEVGVKRTLIRKTKIPMHIKGRLIASRSEMLFLWKLPLPWWEKIKLGVKLLRVRWRYSEIVDVPPDPDHGKFQELDARTLQDFIGARHPDAKGIWDVLCMGSNTVTAHEVAAYQPLNTVLHFMADEFYVEGGTQELAKILHRHVHDKTEFSADVQEIVERDGVVYVTYRRDGGRQTVKTRRCVIAIPGPLVPSVVKDLPDWKRDALSSLDFGSMTSAGFLISEPAETILGEGVWRVPIIGKKFVAVTAPSFTFPQEVTQRTGQGLLRVYTGNVVSRELQQMSDSEALEVLTEELVSTLPQLTGKIVTSAIKHWPHAIIPWRVGRLKIVEVLQAPTGNIHYCGDWTINSGLEAAVISAYRVLDELKEEYE